MDGGFQGCKEERGGGGGGFDTTLVEISPSYSRAFSTIEIVVALFVTELLCAKSLSLSPRVDFQDRCFLSREKGERQRVCTERALIASGSRGARIRYRW